MNITISSIMLGFFPPLSNKKIKSGIEKNKQKKKLFTLENESFIGTFVMSFSIVLVLSIRLLVKS